MNTQPVLPSNIRRPITLLTLLIGAIIATFSLQSARADDIPDRDRRMASRPQLSGIYKVAASTDPFFPAATDREWFMDFGTGVTSSKTSGNVSVSLRQNPHVKVRLMVWQVFPQTNQLYLGNQFTEGSRQAVAVADWQISNVREGVLLERHGYQIVLRKVDPAEY